MTWSEAQADGLAFRHGRQVAACGPRGDVNGTVLHKASIDIRAYVQIKIDGIGTNTQQLLHLSFGNTPLISVPVWPVNLLDSPRETLKAWLGHR
jgi:hypothetical protein